MRRLLLLTGLICWGTFACAQDFTNKGKDFWVGYGNHVRMISGGTAETMQLYITSDVNTSGQVSIQGVAGFPRSFTVTANRITTIDIPRTAALLNEGLYNRGIHVTAEKPIVVYSFIYVNAISGATLCLPTNTLGREYYSINFAQNSNEPTVSYSSFFAVATDTGVTTLEITPAAATLGGRPAGLPFTVTLTQGQVYQVLSGTDLSGSFIRSVNTGSGCKRLAVFCGSGKIAIGCSSGTSDNLYQQMYPTATWGKTYVTVPSINQPALASQNNYYRIFKSDPSANVTVNGVAIPAASFVNGLYYTINATNVPGYIDSDKPIMVAQYFTSQGCSGNSGNGDPEMIYLNPVEQTVTKVTLNSMQPAFNTNINQHYINVVIKNSLPAVQSFRIDGVPQSSYFTVHPNAPGYAYAQIPVSQGAHTITCDTPFNAIAYGFGNAESYGYSAGTNLKDLYQFVTIKNNYASVNFPAGCKGSPFQFSMTFPYQPTKLVWKFNGLFPDTTVLSPVSDSSWVVNGRTLYRYPLLKSYQADLPGTYPISLVASNPTADGCSGEQLVEYELVIFDRPKASFTYTYSGCVTDNITFTDNTDGLGRPLTSWYWDFGGAGASTLANPVHTFNAAGDYTVKHSVITDIGCLSDTLEKIIPVSDPPVADFEIPPVNCVNRSLSFTDKSIAVNGTLIKWTWNFGDGTIIVNNTSDPVQHIYKSAGNYTVSLQVESTSGCKSLLASKPVTVYVNPVADFTLPVAVCLPAGAASFTNTTTISDGTQAQLAYTWDFGDGGTATQQHPVYNYNATGPYSVSLTATSINGCTHDTIKTLSAIYPQPKADFTATPEVCLGAATQFTDKSDGKGSAVVQWKWDFGNGQTSDQQNISYTYAVADTFDVKLSVITDKGCGSDTMTRQVIVYPLPTADFTGSTPACETEAVTFTDASQANAGTLTKWSWTTGDGNTYNTQNPVNTYATPGNYTVTLEVESSKGCVSAVSSKTVPVHFLPVPDFGTPEVCLDDTFAQFTDSSSIGDGSEAQFTYLWNFDDGTTSTQKNPQHKYTAAADYTIQLTVTSKDGCVATISKLFTVNGSVPQAGFNVSNASDLCVNEAVMITDASTVDFGNIVKVEIYWDYGNDPTVKTTDDFPAPGKTYTHKYPDFGNPATQAYEIRYVAYSGISCVSQVSQNITLKASPEIQFDPLAAVCEELLPFPVTTASEIYGFSGTGVFSGPGITTAGIFNPSVAGPGTHTLRYSFVADNGCSTFEEQTIRVNPTPAVDAGPDRVVLEGGVITIVANGSGNNIQYNWTPATGISDAAVAKPQASPPDDITYMLTVTSADGCAASDDVFVKVLRKPVVPNAFTPNGDGVNDTWVILHLGSYPGCTVDVFNRYGQKVYSSIGYGNPWDGRVNGNPLPVGTYYYIINPKNGRQTINGSVTIIR